MSPPSPLFISSKFSVSGSLPTSSNRLSRQAHCSVYPPLSNSVPRSSRFSGGYRPHQSASQSLLSMRDIRLPRIFEWLLFVSPFYLSTLQTVSPHHFISQALLIRLRQNAEIMIPVCHYAKTMFSTNLIAIVNSY